MRVVATQQGYYNHRLIEPGQVFQIRNDGDFAREWMRPAKGETAKPVAKKAHKTEQEILEEEHERQVHYAQLEGKQRAKSHGNAKGEDIEEGEEVDLPPPPAPTFGKKAKAKAKEAAGEEAPVAEEEAPPAPKKRGGGKKKAEAVI
jgi:hypothetical protein